MDHLRQHFLLNPDVVFLNHGSFGATPRPVFAAYQEWQRRLEWQPVDFLVNQLPDLLAEARVVLGGFVNAAADDVVFVPNATFALNVIARSLALGPGDEVLTTDHEYGACENVWRFLAEKRGFTIHRQALPYPFADDESVLEAFWAGVTPQTKVIFLSHITSATALRLPVAAISRRARERGILTIIDGAHAPGQIPLDMGAIDADFYFGNAHKWLCAPKGAAFLYARPSAQPLLEPLVVGWGWGAERTFSYGSDFLDYQQWLGTNDLAAYLSVPAAIQFQEERGWTAVRARCHQLLRDTLARITDLTGLASPYASETQYAQLAVAPLPHLADAAAFKKALLERFTIEIPIITWQDRHFVRISVQGYNTPADLDALVRALTALQPDYASL
jgi:isopenicillin-N epimerase